MTSSPKQETEYFIVQDCICILQVGWGMTRRNEWNFSVIRYMPKAPLSRPIAAILKLKSYWYGNAALTPPPKFNGLVLPNFKHGFDSFEAVPSHTTSSISDPTSPLNTVDFQNGSGQMHFPERGILLLNSPCDYFLCSLFYPHEACIYAWSGCHHGHYPLSRRIVSFHSFYWEYL